MHPSPISESHGRTPPTQTKFPRSQLTCERFSGDVDGFVQGSKAMAKSGTLASHTIQPVEVHIKGSKAVSVSTGSVQIRLILDDIEYDMTSWVIFLSRLSLVSSSRTAQWRLLSLEAVYDRDSIAATKPIVNTSRAIELSPNARPSYKYLEWVMSQRGYSVPHDLPGTDDREGMQAMMDGQLLWLTS